MTTSAPTSPKSPCSANSRARIAPNRTKPPIALARSPPPLARPLSLSTKSSGPSIPATTRWPTLLITPASSLSITCASLISAAGSIYQNSHSTAKSQRTFATTSFSPSKKRSTTSSNTPAPGKCGSAPPPTINFCALRSKMMAAASTARPTTPLRMDCAICASASPKSAANASSKAGPAPEPRSLFNFRGLSPSSV